MDFFEIMEGQSVQLIRGGPEMVIKSINSQGIGCTWFDSAFQKHREAYFQPGDLKVFESPEVHAKLIW